MRISVVAAACLAAGLFLTGPAVAQTASEPPQNTADEPKLDPIFGRRYEEPPPPPVTNDDEYDYEKKGWSPLRGFIGVLNFLTPEQTNLSVGVGPEYKPDYYGSDDYKVIASPVAYIKVKNFIFYNDNGADLALFGFSNFAFGPTIRIQGRRSESANPALHGLGSVGTTFEFGGFAATTFLNRYSVRFKVRHGLKTGHRGTIVDAQGTALLFRWGRVSTSISAQTSWIGNRYADAYFSVTPEQSLTSGLSVYDAHAGFRDVGGSINGYINIGRHWSFNPYVSYEYIAHDIAETPIIRLYGDRNQIRAGFYLMRQFNFHKRG